MQIKWFSLVNETQFFFSDVEKLSDVYLVCIICLPFYADRSLLCVTCYAFKMQHWPPADLQASAPRYKNSGSTSVYAADLLMSSEPDFVDAVIIGCCYNCARVGTLASWSSSAACHILCLLVDIADLITSEDYSSGVPLTRHLADRLLMGLVQGVRKQKNEQGWKSNRHKTYAESNM